MASTFMELLRDVIHHVALKETLILPKPSGCCGTSSVNWNKMKRRGSGCWHRAPWTSLDVPCHYCLGACCAVAAASSALIGQRLLPLNPQACWVVANGCWCG
jgi:hypothetical protein